MAYNKYSNIKTAVDGIKFASKGEARRYCELLLLQRAGQIKNLRLQPSYTLQESFTAFSGKRVLPIRYVADFEYIDVATGRTTVEDFKGVSTKEFIIKMKMFLKRYQDYVYMLID